MDTAFTHRDHSEPRQRAQSNGLSTVAAPSAYEQHRDYVLNVLQRRCGWLDASDREATLHDAYTVMLEKQRDGRLDWEAMNFHQVRAYLTQTALNKALREGDRAYRKRSVALEDGGLDIAGGDLDADALLAQGYEGARVREIVAELPERQQVVVKLRFFFDRSPEEIESFLGVTKRVYRRELERAMRTLAERLNEVREGTFCQSRRSLILAYVAGIAGPNRTRQARRHLDSCPACSHWAAQLRETARQAGAAVPLPLLAGEVGEGGHRISGFVDGIGGVRDRLVDELSTMREHATALAIRADPGVGAVFGGARPGATVAALAGCLVIGSTATYCTLNGIPGTPRSSDGVTTKQQQTRKPPRPAVSRQPARSASTPKTMTTQKPRSAPARSTNPQPQPRKQQTTRAKTEQAERQVAAEFGIEASGSSSAAPSESPSTPQTSSPPASSAGASPSQPPSGGSTNSGGGDWGSEFGP